MENEHTKLLLEVGKLLSEYSEEVERTDLSPASKGMYIDFAGYFVSWMNGDFRPGTQGVLQRRPRTSSIRKPSGS